MSATAGDMCQSPRAVAENILDLVGHTPLVRINRLAKGLPVTVYAKLEMLNPGGSAKDRIAIAMIDAAEKESRIRPGDTIVEATAGNTGAGLALVAAQRGYRCIFTMPDKMSEDKVRLLKAFGAEIVMTPTNVAPDDPESYNGKADQIARDIGGFRPGQFTNPNNPLAHYLTTGPEIWEALAGRVDYYVAGMGTGGSISGTGKFLKEKNPNLTVIGADPEGSILSGDEPRSYKVEGIGEDFFPETFDPTVVDTMVRVSDAQSFTMARRLAKEEGILAGGSCGTAMHAALSYASGLPNDGPLKNMVVLLPDTGRNYLSKIFNDDWMRDNGFPLD